jgi:cobalamin biosynthesis protein CobD/CbiB
MGHYRLNENGHTPEAADIHRAARIVSLALGIALVIGVLNQSLHRD